MRHPNIKTALKIYYESPALGNEEIMKLFGVSKCTALNLKKKVQEEMVQCGEKIHIPNTVNTDTAYKVWGLDIETMEKRLRKMKELGL